MFSLYLYVIKAFKGGQESTRRARFIQEGKFSQGGQESKISKGGQGGGMAGGREGKFPKEGRRADKVPIYVFS